ncbi:MAG: hypothetical protein AMXMBFR13_39860 [Phycisphaerae bacterium]
MVVPTNENPRFLRSLLMASDSEVRAGTWLMLVHRFTIGFPATKRQMYASNVPNSF